LEKEGNMTRQIYQPVPDPQSRLIQIRGVKPRKDGELVQMQVPVGIQEFFAKLLNHLGKRSDWFATCITCEHWKDNRCSKFNMLPPPAVIADACEHYVDNESVPF
jgi:hypothetical protein